MSNPITAEGLCVLGAAVDREKLIAFRRLCVAYGEARAKYQQREDSAELRKECDALWALIEAAERATPDRS